jgi:hypothetical protein
MFLADREKRAHEIPPLGTIAYRNYAGAPGFMQQWREHSFSKGDSNSFETSNSYTGHTSGAATSAEGIVEAGISGHGLGI